MKRSRLLASAALAAALAGCNAAPFEYHSQNEIPRGPGMFSGEEGAFVFRTGEKVAPLPARDSEEWREFQEWKRRNKR